MLTDKHKSELQIEEMQYSDLKKAEKHNQSLLETYESLLENMKREVQNTKTSDFEITNWAHYRAFQDGIIKGLDKAINLIKMR